MWFESLEVKSMPREFKRADRVADAIQRCLAQSISREIRDPRLTMVNINAVEVNRDLANAKVYFTLVGEEDGAVTKEAEAVLNKAASFLRSLIGRELVMRSVPNLSFVYDATSVRAHKLSNLIDQAIAKDKAHQDREDP